VTTEVKGAAATATIDGARGRVDARFDRDKFMVNQRRMSIKEKYYVYDENGAPLIYVERPFKFWGRRTITFYEGDAKAEPLLRLIQTHYWEIWRREYTVETASGEVIARLSRDNIRALFRRCWVIGDADGTRLALARENSVAMSIVRRVVDWIPYVNLAGMLIRTDFDFVAIDGQGNESKVGAFNRKRSVFDKYVLDMSADTGRTIDRRVALAVAVLLDTAEKR
jgi:uncharacterized protein YxjI